MMRAGSPGTKRTMKNTIDVMMNIIGTSVSNRVKIRRSMIHRSTWMEKPELQRRDSGYTLVPLMRPQA
jgi:hypothetical protein